MRFYFVSIRPFVTDWLSKVLLIYYKTYKNFLPIQLNNFKPVSFSLTDKRTRYIPTKYVNNFLLIAIKVIIRIA